MVMPATPPRATMRMGARARDGVHAICGRENRGKQSQSRVRMFSKVFPFASRYITRFLTLEYLQRRGQGTTFSTAKVAETHVIDQKVSTILSEHISTESIFWKKSLLAHEDDFCNLPDGNAVGTIDRILAQEGKIVNFPVGRVKFDGRHSQFGRASGHHHTQIYNTPERYAIVVDQMVTARFCPVLPKKGKKERKKKKAAAAAALWADVHCNSLFRRLSQHLFK
jgi:hypothetical protein